MPAVGVLGLSSAGGAIISTPISKATIDGQPIVGVGSQIAPHGNGPHANAVMVEGNGKIVVDGVLVCVEGDAASCGHVLTGGHPKAVVS